MLKEFQAFILRGNVLDLAVGVIIGAAFTGIVNSLVTDILMPPIGLLLGGVDFSNIFLVLEGGSYDTLAQAQEAGAVTLNVGLFFNQVINFLIIALVIFLVIRAVNKIMAPKSAPEAPATPDPMLQSQEALTAAIKELTATMKK